jgi:cytoskeletal protein RodZ
MDFKKIKEKTKISIEKLRGLDEKQKKVILWATVGIFGLIMGFFWVKGAMYDLEHLEVNFPQLETPSELEDNLQTVQNSFENIESENIKDENIVDDSTVETESKEEIENQIKILEEKLNNMEKDNSETDIINK